MKKKENEQKDAVQTIRDIKLPENDSSPTIRTEIRNSSSDSESDISRTSFKRWHKHMQIEHLRSQRSSFTMWRCCYKVCKPCRWFDTIEYDKKLCKYCFKFKTFKTLGTILLFGIFVFTLSYSIWRNEVLPGGTVFFLFIMFIAAYVAGYLLIFMGLPPLLGHLTIGIIFENIPDFVINRNVNIIEELAEISEKMLLIIALIRAGLLLDMSRIKHHVSFIIELALFPFLVEFIIVWVSAHFWLNLPWDWSAIQGSVMSVVSLATVTSVMFKNKRSGYGEEKDLCTVLIASSVLNVIFGLFFYAISVTSALPEGQLHSFWQILLLIVEEIGFGLAVGGLSGLLIAFFPDKRNTEAAALRILVIGVASFAIGNIFYIFNMMAATALGCLALCVVAANMWEELGWHKDNNPVQYFYTMLYYFSQPIVLSLLGYSMHFKKGSEPNIGYSVAILAVGLLGREFVCFFTTSSKKYNINMKERIYICVAWFSKGTFQILLAGAIHYVVIIQKNNFDSVTFDQFLDYTRIIKETTVISILLTTPLAYISLTILTPILLTKPEIIVEEHSNGIEKRHGSVKFAPTLKV